MGTDEERPPPRFSLGQIVLQYWAPWMANAEEPPAITSKKQRPKWFRCEIGAYRHWVTVKYAGIQHTGHTYFGVNTNGMGEEIPECYLMERHRPRINMYFGGGANAPVRYASLCVVLKPRACVASPASNRPKNVILQ